MELYNEQNNRLDYVWTNDNSGIVILSAIGLEPGNYRVDVTPTFNSISVNAFTFGVYTYEGVTITDF